MLREFQKFLMRGNVVDMAVGLIMALAFGKIVSSFVNDIVMPPIGLLLGHVDFSNLYVNLGGRSFESLAAAKAAGAPTINYGAFLNTLIEFVIVGFVLFQVVRQTNRLVGGVTDHADHALHEEDAKDAVKERLKEREPREHASSEPAEDDESR